jgi:hypothetical protein
MYYAKQTESALWTVGFERYLKGVPADRPRWEPESDHSTEREAKQRAHLLNGVERRYVYLQNEPELWTVGELIYERFEPVSDHGSRAEAAAEVIRLNA